MMKRVSRAYNIKERFPHAYNYATYPSFGEAFLALEKLARPVGLVPVMGSDQYGRFLSVGGGGIIGMWRGGSFDYFDERYDVVGGKVVERPFLSSKAHKFNLVDLVVAERALGGIFSPFDVGSIWDNLLSYFNDSNNCKEVDYNNLLAFNKSKLHVEGVGLLGVGGLGANTSVFNTASSLLSGVAGSDGVGRVLGGFETLGDALGEVCLRVGDGVKSALISVPSLIKSAASAVVREGTSALMPIAFLLQSTPAGAPSLEEIKAKGVPDWLSKFPDHVVEQARDSVISATVQSDGSHVLRPDSWDSPVWGGTAGDVSKVEFPAEVDWSTPLVGGSPGEIGTTSGVGTGIGGGTTSGVGTGTGGGITSGVGTGTGGGTTSGVGTGTGGGTTSGVGTSTAIQSGTLSGTQVGIHSGALTDTPPVGGVSLSGVVSALLGVSGALRDHTTELKRINDKHLEAYNSTVTMGNGEKLDKIGREKVAFEGLHSTAIFRTEVNSLGQSIPHLKGHYANLHAVGSYLGVHEQVIHHSNLNVSDFAKGKDLEKNNNDADLNNDQNNFLNGFLTLFGLSTTYTVEDLKGNEEFSEIYKEFAERVKLKKHEVRGESHGS